MPQKEAKAGSLEARALAAQERLRGGLRRLAAALDEDVPQELAAVREALDEYDALLSEDLEEKTLGWPEDARERISRARVELKHLEAGQAHRRDVVGMVRLVMPRFGEEA
jgi:hypothetical protein